MNKMTSSTKASKKHNVGWRPSQVGWRPFLLGWRTLRLGWKPSLLGWRPSLLGWRPLLLGGRSSLLDSLDSCSEGSRGACNPLGLLAGVDLGLMCPGALSSLLWGFFSVFGARGNSSPCRLGWLALADLEVYQLSGPKAHKSQPAGG